MSTLTSMNEQSMISVYRAIWGPRKSSTSRSDGNVVKSGYAGVSDKTLQAEGAFARNYYAETNTDWSDRYAEERAAKYDEKPILPVFIFETRAQKAIGLGGYYPEYPPAYFQVNIPINLIFGPHAKLRLVKNKPAGRDDEMVEYVVDEQKLRGLLGGTIDLGHGEFYLEPIEGIKLDEFKELVRSDEHCFRPNQITAEGSVVKDAGFIEVNLKKEPDETTAELPIS